MTASTLTNVLFSVNNAPKTGNSQLGQEVCDKADIFLLTACKIMDSMLNKRCRGAWTCSPGKAWQNGSLVDRFWHSFILQSCRQCTANDDLRSQQQQLTTAYGKSKKFLWKEDCMPIFICVAEKVLCWPMSGQTICSMTDALSCQCIAPS